MRKLSDLLNEPMSSELNKTAQELLKSREVKRIVNTQRSPRKKIVGLLNLLGRKMRRKITKTERRAAKTFTLSQRMSKIKTVAAALLIFTFTSSTVSATYELSRISVNVLEVQVDPSDHNSKFLIELTEDELEFGKKYARLATILLTSEEDREEFLYDRKRFLKKHKMTKFLLELSSKEYKLIETISDKNVQLMIAEKRYDDYLRHLMDIGLLESDQYETILDSNIDFQNLNADDLKSFLNEGPEIKSVVAAVFAVAVVIAAVSVVFAFSWAAAAQVETYALVHHEVKVVPSGPVEPIDPCYDDLICGLNDDVRLLSLQSKIDDGVAVFLGVDREKRFDMAKHHLDGIDKKIEFAVKILEAAKKKA